MLQRLHTVGLHLQSARPIMSLNEHNFKITWLLKFVSAYVVTQFVPHSRGVTKLTTDFTRDSWWS